MKPSESALVVLYRDEHWIAVAKPSGLPTTAPESARVRSLVDRVRAELVPKAALVHPLSRLDVEVTGLVLFALTHEAAQRGRAAREGGVYQRQYLALTQRAPEPLEGSWSWPIALDQADPKKRVTGSGARQQAALTNYRTIEVAPGGQARVLCTLETGRTHQVRVHAQRAGCSLLGDRTYGGPRHLTLSDGAVLTAKRVELHAWRVGIPGEKRVLECEPFEDFEKLWAALRLGVA